MNAVSKHLNNADVRLRPHRPQHIRGAIPGTIIMCQKGLVLLTEPNDLRDYTLRPGHQMMIRQKGDVVVEALDDADLTVIYPN